MSALRVMAKNAPHLSANPLGGTHMSNRIFLLSLTLLIILGFSLGLFLASRPSFSGLVVLNAVGIALSIIGVLVFYETIAKNVTYKRIIVSYVAPLLLWALTVIPLGLTVSWFFISKSPHGNRIATFGFLFFAYSILPLSFLDVTVTFPRLKQLKSLNGRHRRFGLFLLLSGLVMQFISALGGL